MEVTASKAAYTLLPTHLGAESLESIDVNYARKNEPADAISTSSKYT